MQEVLSPDDEFAILNKLQQLGYVAGESKHISAVKRAGLACDDPNWKGAECGMLTRKGRTRLLQHRASAALRNCIGRVKKFTVTMLYGFDST